MSQKHSGLSEAHSVQIELEIEIRSSRERVWKALVGETNAWWREEHHAVKNSRMILEPRLGGRLFEEAPDGSAGLWYTVTGVRPGHSISLVGNIAPPYGGPTVSMLHFELAEGAGTVRLQVTDALLGRVDSNFAEATHQGWTEILGEGLKAFVEGWQE